MRLSVAAVALVALVTATLADEGEQQQTGQRSKTKETRTALHVARSLDPADMEEMTVQTRTGETATLLVKRRERDRDGRRVALPFVRPPEPAQTLTPEQNGNAKAVAVPDPVTVRSTPVLVKGHQSPWEKKARSVTSVDEDGVPVVEGVRVPDDPIDKTMVWRNARVIDGKLVPYDKTHGNAKHGDSEIQKPRQEEIQWTKLEPVRPNAWKGVKPAAPANFQPSELIAVMVTSPAPAVQIVEEPASRLDEGGRYVRDRILEYIRRINAQEVASRAQGVARGGHARAMAFAEPRVLQPVGASVYPTSLLYSPPSVVSRVSFEEGVRTPVLQYAHPELGVQPAKAVASDGAPDRKPNDRREQALAYFAHDIHADRSPYAFEPGLEDEARADDATTAGDDNGGVGVDRPPRQQRPRKTLPYFYGASDKYYAPSGGYGTKYATPHVAAYAQGDQRPFWQRMSDSIRSHVMTSMDRVSELAAPVVDPLVEASHKISKNLGLEGGGAGGNGGYRELDTLKEKLGLAGSPSVVLPALGLVAGGAALGLGAVAVGRYLDVDVLQRSRQESGTGGEDEGLSVEHKRAMDAIARSLAEDQGDNRRAHAPGETERQEGAPIVVEVQEAKAERGARNRRWTSDDVEARQSLAEDASTGPASGLGVGSAAVWASTPCAKRVFCEAMLGQSDDAMRITEKKMATYMAMLTGGGSGDAAVMWHLADVMRAVRAGQCSAFGCGGPR